VVGAGVDHHTSEASAYPARCRAMLRDKLPSAVVNCITELPVKKTATKSLPAGYSGGNEKRLFWLSGIRNFDAIDPSIPMSS